MREMLQRKRPHRYLSTVYDSNPYPNRCSLLRVSVQIWYSIIVLFIKRYSDVEKKYFDTLMIMIYEIYLIGAFLWTFPRFNNEINEARQNRPMYGKRMKLKSKARIIIYIILISKSEGLGTKQDCIPEWQCTAVNH